MRSIFRIQPKKHQMRHANHNPRPADELAEIPLAVPELPVQLIQRSEISEQVLNLLKTGAKSGGKKNEVHLVGQGGAGTYDYGQALDCMVHVLET